MKNAYRSPLPLVVLPAARVAAQAHPGHGAYELSSGFVHSFSGIDSVLRPIGG